jgi:hypothetical protein
MNSKWFFETDEEKRRNQVLAKEKSTFGRRRTQSRKGTKKRADDGANWGRKKKFGFAVQRRKPRYDRGFVIVSDAVLMTSLRAQGRM